MATILNPKPVNDITLYSLGAAIALQEQGWLLSKIRECRYSHEGFAYELSRAETADKQLTRGEQFASVTLS